MKKYFLSIIIPCYNEAQRLPKSFLLIADFVNKQKYPIEVVFVDDGSHDDTSLLIESYIKKYSRKPHACSLIRQDYNMGKGAAVRKGMLYAQGDILLFSDADLSTPLSEVNKFLPYFKQGKDIVFGSRELKESVKVGEPKWRSFIGFMYRFILQLVGLRGNVNDTQCGFKAFKHGAAKQIFNRQRLNSGSFDIELLFLCRLLKYSYKEVAVKWRHVPGSTINVLHDMLHHPFDLIRIYYYFFLGYYR